VEGGADAIIGVSELSGTWTKILYQEVIQRSHTRERREKKEGRKSFSFTRSDEAVLDEAVLDLLRPDLDESLHEAVGLEDLEAIGVAARTPQRDFSIRRPARMDLWREITRVTNLPEEALSEGIAL
jgi:hypothetical protein